MMDLDNLDPHETMAIAVAAEVCPKTVRRYVDGKPVRSLNKKRIMRAIAKLTKAKG